MSSWFVVLVSLGAAFAFAVSSSSRHAIAFQASSRVDLRVGSLRRMVVRALSHRRMVLVVGADLVGLALQLVALHFGKLLIVQPLLVTSLVFALLLRGRVQHRPLRRDVVWGVVTCLALGGLLLVASGGGAYVPAVDPTSAIVVGTVGAALVLTCAVLAGLCTSAQLGRIVLGVAIGCIYAATAALAKSMLLLLPLGLGAVFEGWQLYVVIGVGTLGLVLNQAAFQSGSLSASLPTIASVDPLVSVLVGVVVYDEPLRHGAGTVVGLIALLVVLGVAVVNLSREPAESAERVRVPVSA